MPNVVSDRTSTEESAALVAGSNEFALALYRELSERGANAFVSPASISFALAMTYAGAAGKTAEQMAKVLGLARVPDSAVHPGMGGLLAALMKQDSCTLHLANRLYCQAGHPTCPPFLDLVREHYQAEAQLVDFKDESTHLGINEWVEKQTNEKIKNLLAEPLDAATCMVLVNAIYFKGDWDEKFHRDDTTKEKFYLLGGRDIQVDMMFQRHSLPYSPIKGLKASVVVLPYKGKGVNMWLIIPDEKEGLPELETSLTAGHLSGIKSRLQWTSDVRLWLPKFKLEQMSELSTTLPKMGMMDAFSAGSADLSGIDGSQSLYLSQVVHKAFIEVNEEGAEAAAATAAMGVQECYREEPVYDVHADRPFIFLIRDNRSQLILFMGKLEVPTPAEVPKGTAQADA